MQESLRRASHRVPTHPQDTGPCVVWPVSATASQGRMSHGTMNHCTQASQVLDPVKEPTTFSSSYVPFQEWGFHCRTQDSVPTSLGTSLKLEKKYKEFVSHLSRTRSGAKMSLPGWSMERHISPTMSTSNQQLSKSRTWSYRLSSTKPGESKRLWAYLPSSSAPWFH